MRDPAAGLSFARAAPAAWRGVLAAALVAAGGLALAEPALGQAEVELLNTTLTPVNIPQVGTQNTALGCGPIPRRPDYCGISMTDDDFTEAGVTYSMRALRLISLVFPSDPSSNYTRLDVSFGPTLSTRLQSMTLHVGSKTLALASASHTSHGASFSGLSWNNPGLTWTADTPVTIRLTRANVAPTAANGEVVTSTNSAYTFTASDFQFSDVDEEHGQSLQSVRIITLPASGKGTLTLGGTAVTADQSVARSDIDGGRLKYSPPPDEYGDDLASFTFKVSDGTAESSTANTMTVTVTAPLVSIGPDVLVVAEGAGAAVVTVSLDRPRAESALSVLWLTQDGTAEAPNDYTAGEGPLTFGAGESRKEISVPIVDDAVRENPAHGTHESFFVFLDPGQGYRLSDSSITIVEIVDNDGDAPPDLTPPRLTGAAVNGSTLVLTYDETLDGASIPARGDFVVTAAGSTIGVDGVRVSGSAATLALATAVQAGQTVTLDYTPGANPIQDAAGHDAAPLSGQLVTNNTPGGPVTDTRAPLLTQTTVNAATLVLTYDETLDAASVPAPDDFVVTVAGSPVGVNGVSVSGLTVTLTLATAVQAGQTATVGYTPGDNPIQDAAGNDAAPLSGGGGTGGPSVPGAPASLTATAGDGEVALVWSAPADDGDAPITGYEYRYVAGAAVPGDTPWRSAELNLEWTVTGLTNGQQYAFEVRGRSRVGEGEARGALATPVGRLGVPASLTATAGDEEVELAWSPPADVGGESVTGYEYRYAAGAAVPGDTPWRSAGLNLEWTVTGLTNGQRYAFEVRARNREGEGEARGALATPVGRPGVLASLTATAGDGEVALVWSAPADNGGTPVTGYEYRYAAGDAVPGATAWQETDGDLTAMVTGLENGTRYAFEVRARNRVGEGEAVRTTALPLRLRAELFSSPAAAEGEALVIGVRRSGGLALPAHAYIGVTDNALPGVTATEEGRDDGLGRHRLEFAAGAAEATVAVTVAFDGELRQDRALTATLDSAESEVDGVTRAYELVTPALVVPVTEGDAGLSVADARVQGGSAVLAFTVSMDRARDAAVRVDYATEDGSAKAGEDYTPVTGTLTIASGGREATIDVPVLPALHVTGERTLTLRLSNARGAVIDDASATGTIVRESELPKAWLARFGRTASDHATQAIAGRLETGGRETHVTVAGRRVDDLSVDGLVSGTLPSGGGGLASAARNVATRLAASALAVSGASDGLFGADPGTPGLLPGTWGGTPGAFDRESSGDAGQALRRAVLPDFGFRLPGAEEALLGSSFYVEGGAQEAGADGTWAAWGDVAATRFEGDANGLALDGDVVTGTLGLDRQWRALLVGLALSRSSGEGGYGTGAGTIASTLTSVHPYAQIRLADRAQLWGAAGWGRGGLEITPESGTALEADLTNRMGALGGRAVLAGGGALEIALRSDLLWTETSSDETAGLAEAVGTASRGRLMLEGTGRIQGLGGVVRPRIEGGVRYDRGDAETGRGFEVGGGLGWARGSLMLEASGRMLVAHADASYEEWGYSGSLVYAPDADGLGLQMRVGSSAGAAASGVRSLWAAENASGLVRAGHGGMPLAQRFDAEVGYGLGGGALWYPYFVANDSGQTRLGLKLSSGDVLGVGLEFGRREGVDQAPEDAMLLRGELRF